MDKPMIRIHNTETNEVIDREMTASEFVQYEADQAALTAKQAEAEANALAKSALLERMGLSEDEAKLLLG
jgi:hypothetical protein